MPRGVPSRIQVGTATRTYTFREIADGAGLSRALVSLVLRGKRPVSSYAQPRLAKFFGITIEELLTRGTIRAHTPPPRRPRGRGYKITPNNIQRFGRPPVLDRYASSQSAGPQESEPSP